jgi:ribose/xylose/arabinose/galactoside ABC-type transport system permease subunit
VTTDVATADVPAAAPDERLAYRGPIQRLLVQPEIGALLGAISIWVFFWAVTVPFGTAIGTANWLDVAATLGIMAVAVALLMIGGEFDLSAGAMTGATGILVILLVKDTAGGGAGLSLWIGIPLSFVLALGIGWFNGTLVERTALPSFIVTLGAFFVIKGAKLGFAKLFVETIQVGRIDEGAGHDFWRKIFSSVWTRNDHIFNSRDTVYVALLVVGGVAILLGLLELTYRRRASFNPGGLPIAGIGAAAGLVGLFALHGTEGTGANFIWSIVMGAGVLIGAYGIALWRFEPNPDRGALQLPGGLLRPAGLGTGLVILGVFFGLILDSAPALKPDRTVDTIFFLLTEQGLRAILFVGLSIVGLVLLLIAASRARKFSSTSGTVVSIYTAIVVTVLAFIIQSESDAPKFRAELFSVLLLVALLMATWAVVGLYFEQRRFPDEAPDRLGRVLAIAGVVLASVGVVFRLLFTTDSELPTLVGQTQFRVSILWFLLSAGLATWVLARTKFGSWTFAVGGSKSASRQVGVPAARTKTQLFMIVSAAAWLVGMLLAFRLNTIQASTGDGKEFEYIIAAVVGGTLLMGGYGSAAGAAIGAMIMAMSFQGIPFAGWNSDWRFLFLGVILLLAVMANNYIRKTAEEAS